ncbi:hypothetical protein FKM82_000683 [Ascaphus truei]
MISTERLFYLAAQILTAIHLGTALQNETSTSAGSDRSIETYLHRPLKTVKHINHTHKMWKEKDSAETLPFIGLTKSRMLDRHCCKNGGTCILGSFCACPKYFTGRYCDVDVRTRNCGTVSHGQWLQSTCSLCRCVYGVMHCFSIGNCDTQCH